MLCFVLLTERALISHSHKILQGRPGPGSSSGHGSLLQQVGDPSLVGLPHLLGSRDLRFQPHGEGRKRWRNRICLVGGPSTDLSFSRT